MNGCDWARPSVSSVRCAERAAGRAEASYYEYDFHFRITTICFMCNTDFSDWYQLVPPVLGTWRGVVRR